MKFRPVFVIISLFVILIFSCEKPGIITDPDAKLEFSTDTVIFDTIFTTIGSTTKNFRVYNKNNQAISIDRIFLAGDQSSRYRLNIDGIQTRSIDDVEVPANDSIYIFVEVTLDPNNQNDPMVIQDSVVFETNGNTQDVDLVAFGQDVKLYVADTVGTETWTSEKPYLVYGYVYVDSLETLTIEKGTSIHFHKRSSMLVGGTLEVNGTLEEPVSFLGDRLEDLYDDLPGQWGAWIEYENGGLYLLGGIHFLNGSHDNIIDYGIIKNAIKGIQVDTLANTAKPTLTISNTIIENMTVAGILAQSSTILASNCVIADCGTHCVALTLGGSYEFYHCTISNNYNIGTRTDPSVVLNNFFIYEGRAYVYNLYNAKFANCIITGSRGMEIELWNTIDDEPVPGEFNYIFDHCLVQVDTLNTSDARHWQNIIKNINPRFVNSLEHDYHLDTLSPAMNMGREEYSLYFPLDLDGIGRTSDSAPDLGAYERVEGN
jgi:hypothetical protein